MGCCKSWQGDGVCLPYPMPTIPLKIGKVIPGRGVRLGQCDKRGSRDYSDLEARVAQYYRVDSADAVRNWGRLGSLTMRIADGHASLGPEKRRRWNDPMPAPKIVCWIALPRHSLANTPLDWRQLRRGLFFFMV